MEKQGRTKAKTDEKNHKSHTNKCLLNMLDAVKGLYEKALAARVSLCSLSRGPSPHLHVLSPAQEIGTSFMKPFLLFISSVSSFSKRLQSHWRQILCLSSRWSQMFFIILFIHKKALTHFCATWENDDCVGDGPSDLTRVVSKWLRHVFIS